jgi:hypothetical protein
VSSIAYQSFGLERAAWLSARIVVGRVLEIGALRFPGSAEQPAQSDGGSLHFFRIDVLKTLKGPHSDRGQELRIFSPAQWFHDTHASLIRGCVVSYADSRYSGGVPTEEMAVGTEALFSLHEDAAPAGFPPGSVFLSIGEAYDCADREAAAAAALLNGPYGDFDHLIRTEVGGRIRFPDGVEVKLTGNSRKRPMVDGPRSERSEFEVRKDDACEGIELNHDIDADGKESWGSRWWGQYHLELRGMSADGTSIIDLRKGERPTPEA